MADSMFGKRYTKPGEPEEFLTAEEQCGLSTPERFTDWLIEFHGLNSHSRDTVIGNLRSQGNSQRAIGFIAGQSQRVEIHLSLFGQRRKP